MIYKKMFIGMLTMLSTFLAIAQKTGTVYDRYLDFNMARFQGQQEKAYDLGLNLLDSASRLPEKARISYYNSMAKLYEDNKVPEKAIHYYEIVAAAVPNYYVVHRALGYLYLASADDIYAQLTAIKKTAPAYGKLKAEYNVAAKKALYHLGIAQACDPSDDTLTIIKLLYKNTGDTAGLNTLNERMTKISKDCLDILSDN